jgi:hypothetical protein
MQAIEWEFSVEFEYKGKKRLIQPLKILNYMMAGCKIQSYSNL